MGSGGRRQDAGGLGRKWEGLQKGERATGAAGRKGTEREQQWRRKRVQKWRSKGRGSEREKLINTKEKPQG